MHIEVRHFQTTSVYREGPIVISVISFEHTVSVHRYVPLQPFDTYTVDRSAYYTVLLPLYIVQ